MLNALFDQSAQQNKARKLEGCTTSVHVRKVWGSERLPKLYNWPTDRLDKSKKRLNVVVTVSLANAHSLLCEWCQKHRDCMWPIVCAWWTFVVVVVVVCWRMGYLPTERSGYIIKIWQWQDKGELATGSSRVKCLSFSLSISQSVSQSVSVWVC